MVVVVDVVVVVMVAMVVVVDVVVVAISFFLVVQSLARGPDAHGYFLCDMRTNICVMAVLPLFPLLLLLISNSYILYVNYFSLSLSLFFFLFFSFILSICFFNLCCLMLAEEGGVFY